MSHAEFLSNIQFSSLFCLSSAVPEIIDPVFAKTSQNARFLLSENERFGLVFVKTGSINSGTVLSPIPSRHVSCLVLCPISSDVLCQILFICILARYVHVFIRYLLCHVPFCVLSALLFPVHNCLLSRFCPVRML
jgi:hypothetical protein